MIDTLLAPLPRVSDLQLEEAALVHGSRNWIHARRANRCAVRDAAGALGSLEAGGAMHLLLATIGAAWPDPFAMAPRCCPRLTHDEATLVAMVIAGHRHSRPVFDALLCEMLDQDARDRLFRASRALGRLVFA